MEEISPPPEMETYVAEAVTGVLDRIYHEFPEAPARVKLEAGRRILRKKLEAAGVIAASDSGNEPDEAEQGAQELVKILMFQKLLQEVGLREQR